MSAGGDLKLARAAALAAVLTLGTGCGAPVRSVLLVRDAGARHWDVDNVFLSRGIVVRDVSEETKDGVLFVNVLVRNGRGEPVCAEMRAAFVDTGGVELKDPWGWKWVSFEPLAEEWFRFMAPVPADEVGRLRVMVRDARLPRHGPNRR